MTTRSPCAGPPDLPALARRRRLPRVAAPILVAAGLALPAPSLAQSSAAQPSAAQAAGEQSAQLIEDLRALIEKGRQQRLADRSYLRELDELVARYDWPWQQTLLADDFSQEGPAPAAPWQVSEPEWRIDWRHGLRSVVTPPAAQAQRTQQAQQRPSAEEAAKQIIGGLLQEALEGRGSQQGRDQRTAAPQRTADDPGYAAVQAPLALPNAFAVSVELSGRATGEVAQPRLDIGVYQGQRIDAGYRLVLRPGARPSDGASVSLVKLGARGTSSTLELWDGALPLTDGAPHRLQWTRDREGRMQVTLDGQTLFSVVDRGYNDPFDGLVVINSGGDFALRQARVQGVPRG